MSYRNAVQHVTVAQSGTVSGVFTVAQAGEIGIYGPAVTSCAVTLQAAGVVTTPVSADFADTFASDGSALTWALADGPGLWRVGPHPGVHFRLVTGVPQTDVRTFTIFVKS